ncbi:MAG: NAD(P)H-dependent oxidoreductase [Phycisphaerales bacterium]|nr:NAD(P)H-dependent oxidoreductase [Phycisphaerales bacterium]
MQPTSLDTVLAAFNWRYATKKFDPSRKIPAANWSALEQAMTLAPSSFGLQPWRFVVVNDPQVRAKLREVSYGQPQITDASHMVVFARRTKLNADDIGRHIARIAEVQNIPLASLESTRTMMVGSMTSRADADLNAWAGRQLYIALGFFLSAAALAGIDACPMEGFESPKYDQILRLDREGYQATAVATAGYRAADDAFAGKAKVRFGQEDSIRHV